MSKAKRNLFLWGGGILLFIISISILIGLWCSNTGKESIQTPKQTGLINHGDKWDINLEYIPGEQLTEATTIRQVFEYNFTNGEYSKNEMLIKLISSPSLANMTVTFAYSDTQVDNQSTLVGSKYVDQIIEIGKTKWIYLIATVTNTSQIATYSDSIEWQMGKPVKATFDLGCGTTLTEYYVAGAPIIASTIPEVPTNVLGCTLTGWYTDTTYTTQFTFKRLLEDTTIYAKAEYEQVNWIKYDNTNNTYTIDMASGTMPEDLIIPGTYNNGTNGVTSISTISNGAFYNYTTLKSVIIPEGVTSIGSNAFRGCSNLTSITIPESVTEIGTSAFYFCSKLTDLVIPEGVTTIGNGAFRYCYALTSIYIPSTVTSIGSNVFLGMRDVTSIVVSPDNPVFDSRDNCNAIIETSTNTLKIGCKTTIIPSSVKIIGSNAFYYNIDLTNITIPEGVTTIGSYAFNSCTSLTSITISSTVTSIGVSYTCPALTEIVVSPDNPKYDSRDNCNAIIETASNKLIQGCKATVIPATVTAIGSSAFNGMGLTSISLSEGITSIGSGAFGDNAITSITVSQNNPVYDSRNGCNAIVRTAINTLIAGCKNSFIPSTITAIESAAFRGAGLTSITIPENVVSIGENAFSVNSSLSTIVVDGNNSVYDSRNNCNAIIETATNTLIAGCKTTIIPSSVTAIGNYAFYYMGLTSTTINIPEGVTTIGNSVFSGCSSLTNITLPSTLTKIGINVFSDCSKLKEITFTDTTGWYKTSKSNYTNGTLVDVTNSKQNAIWLTVTSGYNNYYWYKE